MTRHTAAHSARTDRRPKGPLPELARGRVDLAHREFDPGLPNGPEFAPLDGCQLCLSTTDELRDNLLCPDCDDALSDDTAGMLETHLECRRCGTSVPTSTVAVLGHRCPCGGRLV